MEAIDKLINEVDTADYSNNVRISINQRNYLELLKLIKENDFYNKEELIQEIGDKKNLIKRHNANKMGAMQNANDIRIERTKKHIKETIEYMRRNNKTINQSTVAKTSECSVNTVRKYKYMFEE